MVAGDAIGGAVIVLESDSGYGVHASVGDRGELGCAVIC
jgi:hypothetical protein